MSRRCRKKIRLQGPRTMHYCLTCLSKNPQAVGSLLCKDPRCPLISPLITLIPRIPALEGPGPYDWGTGPRQSSSISRMPSPCWGWVLGLWDGLGFRAPPYQGFRRLACLELGRVFWGTLAGLCQAGLRHLGLDGSVVGV